MASYLQQAPGEFTASAKQKNFQIVLPMANGKKEVFSVVKTRVIAEALEILHPEIGTYIGESVQTPGVSARITVTPGWGFRAMIFLADKGVEYVEPYAEWQQEFYMAYDRLQLPKSPLMENVPFCKDLHAHQDEAEGEAHQPRISVGNPTPGDGEKILGGPISLKKYRLACATTSEFSQDNGGTKPLVFQKLVNVVNQLNGILERDVNIRLELIEKSMEVIFLDAATDPFQGEDTGGWLDQNPAILGQYVGSSSQYDIGHVFARYPGTGAIGIASLGSCCTIGKGRGCSSWYSPYGDDFLGIAAHEMGHQWSADHTFNQCFEGAQFSFGSACEPGGGSTILGYNSCGSNTVDVTRNLYYHTCSVGEIRSFVEQGSGATCGVDLPSENTAPDVTTPYPSLLYIPIRTPFELTGSGTDPDGNALTYCWDQIDLGPTSPLGSPIGSAPLFQWLAPTNSPSRTFPRMSNIISGVNNVREVLPTISRDITLVLMARDNQLNGGGVATDTVKLKSVAAAGPFLVKYPNTVNDVWKVGEYQTVEWDVANTNKAPINAATVNIRLSTDNGVTFPITLASGVPNTGKYCLQVPNNTGANMRIRVEAAENVFFDISNARFAIEAATPGVSMCIDKGFDTVCLPSTYSTTISTVGLAGFATPIQLSATNLPAGVTATFSPNPVPPGQTATMSLSFPSFFAESTFDIQVQGSANASSTNSSIQLTTINNDFSAFAPTTPVNGATGVNQLPALKWSTTPDADLYDVEIATNPSFAPTVMVATRQNVVVDSFQVNVQLQEGKVYYWRVRPQNGCGDGAWSDVQAFVVAIQNCSTVEANDLPKNISANSTPTVESKITINASGTISDVNIEKIQGSHSFFKDLEAHLIGPSGTDVLLWKDKCGTNGSFNFGMDDGAVGLFNCPPPNNGLAYKPVAALTAFNGQNSAGVWTLRVKDNLVSSGGSLGAFQLRICSSVALNPPFIVVNNVLSLAPGTNEAISNDLLRADDANTPPSGLIFTVMRLPKNGQLVINGTVAIVGDLFNQEAIDNGAVRYYDYGLNLGEDSFDFAVTDLEGGLVTGTYVIQPFTVNTREPLQRFSFDVAPNPAASSTTLYLNQALSSDAQVVLHNISGQQMASWTLASGTQNIRLDLSGMPKGVYAVSLAHESFKQVKKLVVQ
jgi:subtilisin-like proprotein convertase family protein